jgi:hypothetical protein
VRYHRLMRGTLAGLVLIVNVAACGTLFSSPDDPAPQADAGTRTDADAGAVADAAPPPEETPDADAGPPCEPAARQTETLDTPEADGLIATGSAQLFGAYSVCNMSVGRCLFRFKPSAAVLTAFAAKKVVAMSLTLRRADTDTNGNCSGSCTNLRENGTLSAYPLRTDWDELTMSWKERRTGAGWGVDGAGQAGVDIGSLAGQQAFAATDVTTVLALDPSAWTSALLVENKIGVETEFLDGITRRQFVVVAHELGASPHTPAKLDVSYCP